MTFLSPNVGLVTNNNPLISGHVFTITKKVTIAELLGNSCAHWHQVFLGCPCSSLDEVDTRLGSHLIANVVSLEHVCSFSNPKKGNLRLHNQVYIILQRFYIYEIIGSEYDSYYSHYSNKRYSGTKSWDYSPVFKCGKLPEIPQTTTLDFPLVPFIKRLKRSVEQGIL